ncbi:MAG: hypothetical protein V4850_19745 [Myxococcota bacterium]
MLLLTLVLGCGTSDEGSATSVAFDNGRSGTSATTVQGALDELYVRCQPGGMPVTTDAAIEPSSVTNDLAGRIQLLELRQTELQTGAAFGAAAITYDPRKTTLSGKSVQDALDELEARVTKLERGQIDNGAPGPALFELRDKHGNLVSNAPNAGAQKGPQGPGPRGPNGQPGGGAPSGK